jgi:hypothetical protein
MLAGGHFETQVFHVQATDTFLTIDYHTEPTPNSWVMIKRLSAIEILIEPFHGQSYLGVVRVLREYRPPRSERQNPALIQVRPD